MANPYYQSGPERSRRVQALFASIAGRYDLINDLQSLGWHRHWKRRLVRSLALSPGQVALDVCCGTGDIAVRLARTGVRVVGVDFSLPMLQQAVARSDDPTGNTAYLAGDGLRLPFQAEVFDGVTVAYGLRNLPDFAAALREFARVTKPGGRVALLDFGKPRHWFWRRLYFGYLRRVVPVLGRAFCGDAHAYAYILESLQHFPDQAGIAALLRQSGWGDVLVHDLFGGVMGLHLARKIPSTTNPVR